MHDYPRQSCGCEACPKEEAKAELVPRHASTVLRRFHKAGILSGFNIPNKKPGEPLLEWAVALVIE